MYLTAQKVFSDLIYLVLRLSLILGAFFFFAFLLRLQGSAATSDTLNFQGKVALKTSGINISTTNTDCVLVGSDTCAFKVKYYDATSAGNLLFTEQFNNVELGSYDGVFNLGLGTGTGTAGTESNFKEVFTNNSDVFLSIEFDYTGDANFAVFDTFTVDGSNRLPVRSVAFSLVAQQLVDSNTQFIKNQTAAQTGASFNIAGSGEIGLDFVVATDLFVVDATSSRVGIGTASPSYFFSIGADSSFGVTAMGNVVNGFNTLLDGSSTTNGSASSSSNTLILNNATDFQTNNYVKIGTTYHKIVGKAGNTLTISPATTWSNSQTVTEYNIPEIGGANAESITVNPFGTGVFIDGIKTGNTKYTEGLIYVDNQKVLSLQDSSVGILIPLTTSANISVAGASYSNYIGVNSLISANPSSGSLMAVSGLASATGTSTNAYGLFGKSGVASGSITLTNSSAIYAAAPTIGSSAAITNAYGVYIENITGATTNYSIYSAGGQNYLAGNLGIGVAVPNQALDVNGRIRMATWTADGDVAVYKNSSGDFAIQSSDERLKKNFNELVDSISAIQNIRTLKFNWINDSDDTAQTLGVIAQDVQKVLPEAVFTFTNDISGEQMLGVHYEKLSVLALSGVKELANEMDLLKSSNLTGDLFTTNADGHIQTLNSLIVPSLNANSITADSIITNNISALSLEVSGLINTEELQTNLITVLSGKNLSIKLPDSNGSTALDIINTDNKTIFAVNSNGELFLSGKLNISTTGGNNSTGTAVIPAGQAVYMVNTSAMNADSKVFISVNDVDSLFPEVKVSAKAEGAFELKLKEVVSKDIQVDWWIIN